MNAHPGWSVTWLATASGFNAREVFKGPDGTEYLRTRDPELASTTLKTSCGDLYLRRRYKLRGED